MIAAHFFSSVWVLRQVEPVDFDFGIVNPPNFPNTVILTKQYNGWNNIVAFATLLCLNWKNVIVLFLAVISFGIKLERHFRCFSVVIVKMDTKRNSIQAQN